MIDLESKCAVLWAEDDQDDREFFKTAFQQLGKSFSCVFVNNGLEVLDWLAQVDHSAFPNLIVLDINMPLLDGMATMKQLKEDDRYRAIPIALVSTAIPTVQHHEFLTREVVLRTKPESISELVDMMVDLLLMAGIDF